MVLNDQAAALRRVHELVDEQDWRADKRARWSAMLRRLVHGMNWTTGLVCGVTREQLAATGGCSVRTVSALLAWAQDAGLLVVVECGAAAAFLGCERNRAPAYALVTDRSHEPGQNAPAPPASPAVDASCNLPQSPAGSKPLAGGRRLNPRQRPHTDWPAWQVPATPAERSAAVATLLARIGLDAGRVPDWRARALLHHWWAAGACIAGLLYALDHYPDRPGRRGDALRAAVDPLRVLGHRLRPWAGQLHRLPAELDGHRGDYRAQQAARLAERVAAAGQPARPAPSSTVAARAAAKAQLAELLVAHRRRPTTNTGKPDPST